MSQDRDILQADILYLNQDMREFELYGTVRGIYSACDCLNYILEEEELKKVFALANNYLDPGGIFVFDVNTPYKYYELLAENTFAETREEGSFIWENYFDEDEQINEYLKNTKFENRPQGRIQVFGSNNIQNSKKVFLSNPTVKKNEQVYTKSNKKNKPKQKNYFAGTILSEENKVTVQLLDKNITFDVRGFFQSNLHVYQKVINLIIYLLPGGQNILDMYAGCGSISAFLGKKYQNVTLVEHNRDTLVFAEENMKETPHVSYGLSGENWVKTCASFCPKFDAVVIDPPRSGMEKEVRDYLCKSKIPFICSLSCDPTTQARDIKELLENGYEIQKTYLLDFYPNTSHIESLVYLKLKV